MQEKNPREVRANAVRIISPCSQFNEMELNFRLTWNRSVKLDLSLHLRKWCHLPLGQPAITHLVSRSRWLKRRRTLGWVSIPPSSRHCRLRQEIIACSCRRLHIAPGLRWTDASGHLTHLLGDGATLTRFRSTGSGTESSKRSDTFLENANSIEKGLGGLQCPARLWGLQLLSIHHHILRLALCMVYNSFHGNLRLTLKGFSLSASFDSGLGSLDCIFRQPIVTLCRKNKIVSGTPEDWISAPLSVAGFGVTSFWSSIISTSHRRSLKRLQRGETFASMTSSCAP